MIQLSTIQGVIRRRMLINFRVDPGVMQKLLPSRFRPKLQHGFAIAGICLIRLENIRPKHMPEFLGLTSENAAHRVAVTWKENGVAHEGVYIPRRDTGSLISHFAGGRLFPGEHHRAVFDVSDDGTLVDLKMHSTEGNVAVEVRGRQTDHLPKDSLFKSIDEASKFFEGGSVGYSVTTESDRLDGVKLKTRTWRIEALNVEHVKSTWFADETHFPKGSTAFDCGLVMRDIPHEWQSEPDLYV